VKKKLGIWLAICLMLVFSVMPVYAFSGIQFKVLDGYNSEPWGTSDGQSYRIVVTGSTSGTLLDTTTLTTPTDPVLDFTCSYDSPCPPSGTETFTGPVDGETVTVYIILTGTEDNPGTIVESFQQPPLDLGTYTINVTTNTGPNAVTFTNISASSNIWLPVGLIAGLSVLALGALVVLRKRT
jgi:hypothetical protein